MTYTNHIDFTLHVSFVLQLLSLKSHIRPEELFNPKKMYITFNPIFLQVKASFVSKEKKIRRLNFLFSSEVLYNFWRLKVPSWPMWKLSKVVKNDCSCTFHTYVKTSPFFKCIIHFFQGFKSLVIKYALTL